LPVDAVIYNQPNFQMQSQGGGLPDIHIDREEGKLGPLFFSSFLTSWQMELTITLVNEVKSRSQHRSKEGLQL
jgi:hypothetical protein